MNQRLHDFAGLDIDPLAALRHSRGLQHLTDEELAPLARELQPVRYDSGTTFFKQFEANHDAPLRVLLQGQLFWTPIANVETAGAPTLDAGALFGLSSINAWARKHPSWSVLAVDEHPGFLAEANDELWALELPLNSYHRAFARPESKRLITRLIGLYGARPDAPKVVRALRRTPEFSRACPMHVSRVVEGGVLERWLPDKPILADGSSEHMALRYVVSGKVRVIDEHDGQSTVVGANELIPHRAIFSDRGPARTFIAIDGPAEVIRIRRQTLDFTIRTTPGFARTLGPATLGSWLRDSAGYERSYPIIASGEMTLVLADPTVDPLPLSALCALLAEAANEHLDDRTTVVKLVPAGPEVAPRSSPFGVPEILPVAKEGDFAAAVRETIIDLAHQWGLLFDHIILDPSPLALTPKERLALMRAMVDLPCPSQISYLVANPEHWADLPRRIGVASGVSILPTAMLGPRPHWLDLETMRGWMSDVAQGRWRPGGEQDIPGGAGVRRSPTAQAAHVVGQLFGVPSSYPIPWPLDAVRMRLGDDVLVRLRAAQRVTESAMLTIDGIDLEAEQAEQLRECMRRWARAVTWRRVGLGIGGAGSQSYVAIPFIRRLREVGIPLDVISGSSTGAFIGAFYSALGD
ncbi:MAG: hypothetical protein KC431_15530, partial [Myxococcales bacterium]|nr:hypothetical protein [Myxococcales bacterium]